MRISDRVTFVDPKGVSHPATVTDVVDTGASGYKMLDLSIEGGKESRVPHRGDQQPGEGFWLLVTETETPPERRAPVDEQPIKLAQAAEAGTLPESDRRSEGSAPDARRKAVK